jgi:hypothetical protein
MTPERFYAALLMLYPKPFRDEYGASMQDAFRELRESNRLPPLALWRFVVSDSLRSAVHQQLDACRSGSRQFALRWLASCAIGLIVTVFVANTVAWTLSYFYHPYLEGLTIPPWGYGTCLGFVLGGTIGLGQWMLLPTHAARVRAWALASGIALPIVMLTCAAVAERTLVGVNPVAADPSFDLLQVLMPGLRQPKDWTAFAIQFIAMALSGLLVGAVAMRSQTEGRHAY